MPGQATVTIRDKQWAVSVATTADELAQGLKGVESIPAGTGMLFDVGTDQIITVNTEGMLFPIDGIFISSDLKVTEMTFNMIPEEFGTASLPARYYLEVNAGEVVGIEDGDDVTITYAPVTDLTSLIAVAFAVLLLGTMGVTMAKEIA